MFQLAENIPGKPHKWSAEIAAWAAGRLVQWRWGSFEATDADWRDCDYPSRGMPAWENDLLSFRIAPEALQVAPIGEGG